MTDEQEKDFLPIKCSEYFKSIKGKQNIRKVVKLLYIFLTTPDEVENMYNQLRLIIAYVTIITLNLFDP